jgi:hypothetical protein
MASERRAAIQGERGKKTERKIVIYGVISIFRSRRDHKLKFDFQNCALLPVMQTYLR